jgi:hypothetical protein
LRSLIIQLHFWSLYASHQSFDKWGFGTILYPNHNTYCLSWVKLALMCLNITNTPLPVHFFCQSSLFPENMSLLLMLSLLKWCFFFVVLGLELKASTLSYSTSPFCDKYFWDKFSWTTLPGLASNHDPPDLCLLSS